MHTSDIELERFADFQPTAFDHRGVGSDGQEDWLVLPISQTRDSGLLEKSNFDAAEDSLRRVQKRCDKARRRILHKLNRLNVSRPFLGVPVDRFAQEIGYSDGNVSIAVNRLLNLCGLPPVEGETIAAFAERLETALDTSDFETHRFGHWGPGWFEIIVVRPGSACHREAQAIAAAVSNYPVLDESDYCEREHEATMSNLEDVISTVWNRLDGSDDYQSPPNAGEVWRWLCDNEQSALESRDDRGAYPSEESVERALEDLGYLTFDDHSDCEDCSECGATPDSAFKAEETDENE